MYKDVPTMKGCRSFVGNSTKTIGHDNENDSVNDFSNADTTVKEEADDYEKDDVTYITSPLKEETTHRCSLKMKIKRKVKTENESFHEIIDSSIQAPKKTRSKRKTFSSSTTRAHEQVNECESGKTYRNEIDVSKNVQKIDHPSEDLQEKIIFDDPNASAEVDTADACVETSLGHFTEPEGSGPCEPGTSVVLEGVVWNETPSGVLVVNVSWRGRTYVGTLLDASKQDWRTPRLMNDGAGVDVDYKGKSSRNRKKNCLMKSSSSKKTKKAGVNEESSTCQYVVESECAKLTCDEKDCFKQFKSFEGLAYHKASAHANNSVMNETNVVVDFMQNPLNLKADVDKNVDEKTLSPYHAFKIQSDAGNVCNSEPDINVKSPKEDCALDDSNFIYESDAATISMNADNASSEEKFDRSENFVNGSENLERASNSSSNESSESIERAVFQNTSPQPVVSSPLQFTQRTGSCNSKRTNVSETATNKKTKFPKIQNGYEIPSSSNESASVEIARLQTLTEDIPISFASEIDSIVGPDDVNIRRRPQRFDPSLGIDTMDMSDNRPQNFSSQFYLNESHYYHRPPSWAASNSFQTMPSPICDPLHLNAMNDYLNRCILNRNPSSKNS